MLQFQSSLPRGERLLLILVDCNFYNFNPRSREGSDSFSRSYVPPNSKFQSSLPRGERQFLPALLRAAPFDFNPRSREGSDPFVSPVQECFIDFNPRSREGSDLCPGLSCIPPFPHFNPRSREGSDTLARNTEYKGYISILAPARGATKSKQGLTGPQGISILAPARGATCSDVLYHGHECLFQSSLPRGERHRRRPLTRFAKAFQSSLPRGERRIQIRIICGVSREDFNPRSREGSDLMTGTHGLMNM